VNGAGADTDIVVASAKAYISALNKLVSKPEKVNPQVDHALAGFRPPAQPRLPRSFTHPQVSEIPPQAHGRLTEH
jgi:hypothetical protein